ncbi:MAG: pyridoxamine 5'-phosphate oxidase family protein [Thermoplasmatales archaeon]
MDPNYTKVKRHPERASYEKTLLLEILRNNFVCEVSFQEDGQPFIIPMSYYNDSDFIYLHAAPSSRIATHLRQGDKICISVLEINGIVIAKGMADNSINYRSVIIYGRTKEVMDKEEKINMYAEWIDRMLPGRRTNTEMPNEREIQNVSVFKMPMDKFSIKIRNGGPIENRTDPKIWSGVIPIFRAFGKPTYSSGDTPDYVKRIIDNNNKIC